MQAPTTLLAQVNSSVGGKTGIDTPQGKNLVGAFHQPSLVLTDIDTLKTLPKREFLSGYAEVVKYGALGDAVFFRWLEQNVDAIFDFDAEALAYAIETCCQMKAEIVSRDEKESGDRALLNLGHTFGHAIEAWAGYSGGIVHGEAIAVGMELAFRFSASKGYCGTRIADRLKQHLMDVGLPADFAGVRQAHRPFAEPRRADDLYGAGQEGEGRADRAHPRARRRRRLHRAQRAEGRESAPSCGRSSDKAASRTLFTMQAAA